MLRKLRRRKSLKGFTLVEVIITLVIIAILASVSISALTGYIDKARDREAALEAKRIYIAAQAAVSEVYGDSALNVQSAASSTQVVIGDITLDIDDTPAVGTISSSALASAQSNKPSSPTGDTKIASLILEYTDSSAGSKDFRFCSDVLGDSQKPEDYFKNQNFGDHYAKITYNSNGQLERVIYSKRGLSGVVVMTRFNNKMDYVVKDTLSSAETRE